VREGPKEYFLSSKARYQQTLDDEAAADLFFAIRNMANHGLDVEWDDILEKALERVGPETEKPEISPEEIRGLTAREKRLQRLRQAHSRFDEGEGPKGSRVGVTPMLVEQKTAPPKQAGYDSEGRPLPNETQEFYSAKRMPGTREAGQSNSPIIPSRHFDIQSLFRYTDADGKVQNMTAQDIRNTYRVLHEYTPDELKEKGDELIPNGNGITYGDYVRIMTGRPHPPEDDKMADPIQALGIFSDFRPTSEDSDSFFNFHSEFLDPDSHHFVKKVDKKVTQKNLESKGRSLKYATGKRTDTHLDYHRAIDRKGNVVGDELPSSDTWSRVVEESYERWSNKIEPHISSELSEKAKRRLFSDWFILESDIGSKHDDYIATQLLNPDGTVNERYSRSQLLMDTEFRRMRDEAHDRVGLFPYLLGLQFGDPEARQYAMAEFLGYAVNDPDHDIEKDFQERHDSRDEHMGKMRIDELLDHMHTAFSRNWSAIAQNLMAHTTSNRGFLPPVFDTGANMRRSIISAGLAKAHAIQMDPEWLKKKTDLTGYDSLYQHIRAKAKSIAAHVKSTEGLEWDDRNGVPANWDFDKPPMDEFREKCVPFIPPKYQASAVHRFRHWLHEDPDGFIRGMALSYLRNAAHEYFAVEPLVQGEGPAPHEEVTSRERSPTWLWHASLGHTGYNLEGPDIGEIVFCLAPWMGETISNRDLILFDTYNTKPPEIDSPEYRDWLRGIGNSATPKAWQGLGLKNMSLLAHEIDAYLRKDIMGDTLKSVFDKSYGHLEDLDLSKEELISRVLQFRMGELLQEEKDEGIKPDSPERADSFNISTNDERSSQYKARLFDESTNPHGRRAGSERIFRLLPHIFGLRDAVFLRNASEIGVLSPHEKLVSSLQSKGKKISDETKDALFDLKEMEDRRLDGIRRMGGVATILRGSNKKSGAILPHLIRGATLPIRVIRHMLVNMAHGKDYARLGVGDSTRDPVHGNRGGGLTHSVANRAGVHTNKGLEAGQSGLLLSALLGHGSTPAWEFEHEGKNHLVVDKPQEWGDKWLHRYDEWLQSQKHPHSEGSLAGHLGLFTDETNWRDHREVTDGKYLYPIEKTTNDEGEVEYRISLKKDEGYNVRMLDIPDKATPCPKKLKGSPQWNRPFNIWGTYEDRELEDSPWMVIPIREGEEKPDCVIEDGGKSYFIGEHPAKMKDDYAMLLGRNPDNDPREILELRRKAGEIAPKMPVPQEKVEQSDDIARGHELLIRAVGDRQQAIKAVLPILIARVASEHEPEGFDHYLGDSFTDEDRAEYKLKHFIDNYLQQTGDPADIGSDSTKYAHLCYLIDQAAKYADSSHIESRPQLLHHLERQGFKFTDKEREAFLHPGLDSDTRYDFGHWGLSEEIDNQHPFNDAYNEGKGRDVEGLNLLRSYTHKYWAEERDNPEMADALRKAIDAHFSLFGKLYDTGRKQPVEPRVSELTQTGKGNEHRANIRVAQHHLGTQDSEDPDWDPIHYIKEGDNKFATPSKKAKNIELARRGLRAKMALDLRDHLTEVTKLPEEAINFNNLLTALQPVMKLIIRDLKKDDLLPEHRPHDKLDLDDRGDLTREYTRLLFLKAPVNDDYEIKPWSIRKPRPAIIGDDVELNKDGTRPNEEHYGGLWLPDMTGVHGQHLYGDAKPIHFRLNVGSRNESTKAPSTMRGAEENAFDIGVSGPWDDPSRDRPTITQYEKDHAYSNTGEVFNARFRNYDVGVINSAFGQDLCMNKPNPQVEADTRLAEGDPLLTSLDVLTDVDLLLKEEDRDKGKPVPVKAMHRIFELDDLEYLRGFSDDWVVTSWADGTRVIVEKKGKKVKARNSEGKAVSLPNEVKRGVVEAHDKDFLVDAIWDEDSLHIVDLLECEDDDLCNRATKDRVRHLRAHFESTERVVTPAPVNTKRVDGEGLKRAVKDLLKEPKVKQILLRDAESTYMRGETRHPKWVMLTPDQHVDVLIISSSSDDSHLVGIGPLYDEDGKAIGNRGVKYDGDYYMDVGTISRSGLEEGMYVTVKTSGISHSVRRGYSVYRLNAPRYVKDCEGGATDSVETLDILRNRQEGNIPHKVRIKKGSIHIEVPSGHVVYDTEPYGNAFALKAVDTPDDYTLRIVESQMDYWSPLAAVLLRSERESEKEDIEPEPPANHDKKPKKVIPKKDRLLKDPEVVKTVVVALEAVEGMLKEKVTMTGPKALGIDYATPVESPRGPTKVTEPYDLPDHDPAARQSEPKACWCGAEKGDECKQGMGHKMEDCPDAHPAKKKKKADHLTVSQDYHTNSSV